MLSDTLLSKILKLYLVHLVLQWSNRQRALCLLCVKNLTKNGAFIDKIRSILNYPSTPFFFLVQYFRTIKHFFLTVYKRSDRPDGRVMEVNVPAFWSERLSLIPDSLVATDATLLSIIQSKVILCTTAQVAAVGSTNSLHVVGTKTYAIKI